MTCSAQNAIVQRGGSPQPFAYVSAVPSDGIRSLMFYEADSGDDMDAETGWGVRSTIN